MKKSSGGIITLLLIPVFLLLVLVIIDTIVGYTQNKTFKEVTERVIEEVVSNEDITVEDYKDEIKRVYERRGYKTDGLVVEATEDRIYVENDMMYFGIFSSLKKHGEEMYYSLFGIEQLTFKLKKGSKAFVRVEATFDENNELVFEYLK